MHATDKSLKNQQKRVTDHVRATDNYGFFNLLTGPELLDVVEAQFPEHRERLYTPAVTLSLFMTQVLSSDGSCQNTVNGYVVSRAFNGLEPCEAKWGQVPYHESETYTIDPGNNRLQSQRKKLLKIYCLALQNLK